MYALVVGRAYPDKKTGMLGIFEFEQAVALNKHGLKSVYAFCDTRSIKSLRVLNYVHFDQENVPVYGYHFPIGGFPRKVFDSLKTSIFKRLLNKVINEQGKPDIIHVHFPLINLNEQIWDLIKGLKVPIIVTEHWSKVQLKVIEPYRIELLKKIVHESDSFNCVGEKLKQSVIELTNTTKNIQVIPNMVNPIFSYEEQPPKNKFEFIAIGRLVETKRFGLLIDAFSKAFPDNNNVYLNIVGDGPLYKKLKEQIENIGMNDRIFMHGYLQREKTADLLKKSDAFVSASVIETFGVPFIEAMACGKPVIGIKDSSIETYINESNGELFEQDNIKELINSLVKLYKNKQNYDAKKISKAANYLFSETAVIKKLLKIYGKELP